MPAKSKHGKGKHPHHSKKKKAIMRQAGSQPQPQPQATATAPKPAEPARVTAETKPARTQEAAVLRYPYVTEELKRIGILAGIIIVVLIVLSIIL